MERYSPNQNVQPSSTENEHIRDMRDCKSPEETLETVEDEGDCGSISENYSVDEMDRKDPIVAAIIRANGTAIKQENHRDEWVDCLQWLNHVGLGKHCDTLASQWEEDEIDFPTLKRLDHGDLVCSIGLFCFIAILCLL